jgi:microcin C transport system substrate-binding protein
MNNKIIIFIFISLSLVAMRASAATHALTFFEQKPKYAAGFKHFDYVNPAAPKGGSVKLYHPITFDSLNPFILKGVAAPAINLTFDTLMTPSLDEPQTYYPLIAKSVHLSDDKTNITFFLDERAKFQDGSKITVDDVIFSFNILKTKGHPIYKLRLSEVEKVMSSAKNQVTFKFNQQSKSRELPFLIAALPIFSKAYFKDRPFDKTSLEAPLGSGAYKVAAMEAGRYITYERVKDYWAHQAKVASRVGYFNFDKMRYDIYRDETVALEAFKAHQYDMREEYVARNWALSYNFSASKNGDVILDNTPHQIPRGLQGFIFNLRKPKFQDKRVREAIALAFDFEWMNKTLFYDAYTRNNSLFQSTPFAARDLPVGAELEMLEQYRNQLAPEVFTQIYNPPLSNGSGFIRERMIAADKLLTAAGYVIRGGVRVNQQTGEPLTIEVLSRQKSLDKVVLAMARNLKVLGVVIKSRIVDESQFQKRWDEHDFELTTIWWNMGVNYPGNEQLSYWSCDQVNVKGGQNMAGFCHPVVDKLLQQIGGAESYPDLQMAARSLDRIIMSEHIIIPHFSINKFRMAYWNIFGIPKVRPLYDRGFETWWLKK